MNGSELHPIFAANKYQIELNSITFQYTLEELRDIVPEIWEKFNSYKIWLFYGQVGAGKTTFIKEVCNHLKVQENTQSPTFSLINEYAIQQQGQPDLLYHIDLYRIESLEEALNLDIESYLDAHHYCFIEWPEVIEPLVSERVVKLFFEFIDFNSRKILIL